MENLSSNFRYWAFISYSSKDVGWARWLHRAIESYGIPAQLIKHPTPAGEPAPKRFQPVFRDRDEFPASPDLGARIEEALRGSRYLIVVCSRHAAQSKWVNQEIKTFQDLNRHQRILAIIVDGEPNTGDQRECFPPALRQKEPLASDARNSGDGKNNAKLKILAGMLGVDFDTLKQRDAQRQIRNLQKLFASAVIIVLGFATITWYAEKQRQEAIRSGKQAEHQRNEAVKARQQAEGIMNYMLNDLRDKLEPVGRLDIIRDVQKRVDDYYGVLGVETNDTNSLRNRATAYCDEGDTYFAQGYLTNAMESYLEYQSRIQSLVTGDPSNTLWLDDLAVSQVKIGDVLEAKGDLPGALESYEKSLAIIQRLLAADSSNPRWLFEISTRENDIGFILMTQHQLPEAVHYFRKSLEIRQELANDNPSNPEWQHGLSSSLLMNGDALRTQGDLDQALSYYQKGESVIKQLAETAPSNAGWQRDVSVSYDKIGDVLMAEGHWAKALDNYRSALAIRQRLVIADPSNTEWQNDLIYSYCRLAEEAESSGTGGAIEWWRKAYAGLSAVHQNGTMRQSDQVELERLRKKVEMP